MLKAQIKMSYQRNSIPMLAQGSSPISKNEARNHNASGMPVPKTCFGTLSGKEFEALRTPAACASAEGVQTGAATISAHQLGPAGNPWRTHFWQMLRLFGGVLAGTGARIGILGSSMAIAGTYLYYAGATTVSFVAVALAAVNTKMFLHGINTIRENDLLQNPAIDDALELRLEAIINDLCQRNNLPKPKITLDLEPDPARIHFLGKPLPALLAINPVRAAPLNDRELSFILAHELAHGQTFLRILRRVNGCAAFVSAPILFCGLSHYCANAQWITNTFSPVIGTAISLGVGIFVLVGFYSGLDFVRKIGQRSEESVADLVGVYYTGDSKILNLSFLKGFPDEYGKSPNKCIDSICRNIKHLNRTHPDDVTRAERILKWFKK